MFEETMRQIRSDVSTTPAEFEKLEASVLALAASRASSWHRHPLRRAHAAYQRRMIVLGDWLFATFPFLRPPAEWAVGRLERLLKRR